MSIAYLEIQQQITPSGNEISMLKVRGGNFLLNDEIETEIGSFWLGQYQVSQELWQEIMGKNPSQFAGKNLPVENVSWDNTQLFLAKLNKKLSLTGDCVYRLPTEAEWEYAARGGLYTLGTTYSGSNDVGKVASYDYRKAHTETQEMGMKVPNELGLYDLSGNVFEWCEDWYASYPAGPLKDPKGPEEGHSRVLRGGSWSFLEGFCRVSNRSSYRPGNRNYDIGFRLSRTAW